MTAKVAATPFEGARIFLSRNSIKLIETMGTTNAYKPVKDVVDVLSNVCS